MKRDQNSCPKLFSVEIEPWSEGLVTGSVADGSFTLRKQREVIPRFRVKKGDACSCVFSPPSLTLTLPTAF